MGFADLSACGIAVDESEHLGSKKDLSTLAADLSPHVLEQVEVSTPSMHMFDGLSPDRRVTEWTGFHDRAPFLIRQSVHSRGSGR